MYWWLWWLFWEPERHRHKIVSISDKVFIAFRKVSKQGGFIASTICNTERAFIDFYRRVPRYFWFHDLQTGHVRSVGNELDSCLHDNWAYWAYWDRIVLGHYLRLVSLAFRISQVWHDYGFARLQKKYIFSNSDIFYVNNGHANPA